MIIKIICCEEFEKRKPKLMQKYRAKKRKAGQSQRINNHDNNNDDNCNDDNNNDDNDNNNNDNDSANNTNGNTNT